MNCIGSNPYWHTNWSRPADCGFVATESQKGGQWVAQMWERAWRLFTNIRGPCLHGDPILPDCEPWERVSVKGKALFFEGSWDELVREAGVPEALGN